MVYDLLQTAPGTAFQNLSLYLPAPCSGLTFLLLSFLLMATAYALRKRSATILPFFVFAALIFASAGVFMYTAYWIDEVFINLEHPYNLYHHGLFSFSPERMVDGTVEFLYYLILTPFAMSQKSLTQANYALGLLLTLGHTFLFWKMTRGLNFRLRTVASFAFITHLSFTAVLSSGFGNGLVSLGFMICLYLQITARPKTALLFAALLPLMRPDGVFYASTVCFTDLVTRRKASPGYWLLIACSVLAYCSAVKFFYGHWIPVPASFKSFAPGMVHLPSFSFLHAVKLTGWWAIGVCAPWGFFHYLFFTSLILSSLPFVSKKIFGGRHDLAPLLSNFRLLHLYGALLAIFLFLSTFTSFSLQSQSFARYVLPVSLFSAIYGIAFLLLFRDKRLAFALTALMVVISIAGTIYGAGHFAKFRTYKGWKKYIGLSHSVIPEREQYLGRLGELTEKIIPQGWSVAMTELNTFGFMMKKTSFIDLWGYTEPRIAYSKMLNAHGMRKRPGFFLEVKPDISPFGIFPFKGGSDYEFYLAKGSIAMLNEMNLYGSLIDCMKEYDLFILSHPENYFTFLVRKDHSADFLQRMLGRGYSVRAARELDNSKLAAIYDPVTTQYFI